ncbi:MAG: hypothetical protein LBP56_01750 [Odoribacteraceae bacterium]|nr:hypothetical protein [Odoribacteraceae bacterium]
MVLISVSPLAGTLIFTGSAYPLEPMTRPLERIKAFEAAPPVESHRGSRNAAIRGAPGKIARFLTRDARISRTFAA